MRIEATRHVFHRQLDKALPDESQQESVNQDFVPDRAGKDGHSRALVVTGTASSNASASSYRQANFLAHLIATREQAPQTRERRRAEPREAAAAYQAMKALTAH